MPEHKLRIGITQGDTNGIGWEVILKALADPRMTELFTPVVYGSPKAAAYSSSRWPIPLVWVWRWAAACSCSGGSSSPFSPPKAPLSMPV